MGESPRGDARFPFAMDRPLTMHGHGLIEPSPPSRPADPVPDGEPHGTAADLRADERAGERTAAVDEADVRVGVVRYLNSKPLIEGLGELASSARLVLDYPSRLADALDTGTLDVALVPSVECLGREDYVIVSDACVATRGPVMSVKLHARVPLGEVRTLALDEGSRTSAALVRVMLAERYGVVPQLRPLLVESSPSDCDADAILLIGDRAMHPPTESFAVTWDLGEEWLAWTGLPFVFAVWAARTTADVAAIEPALSAARDRGVVFLEEIARREAAGLGISVETATRYLTRNLHYRLGDAERSGLALFHELAVANGLVGPHEPRFATPPSRTV